MLNYLIGYRHNCRCKNVRAVLDESRVVLPHLLDHESEILKAIRKRLDESAANRITQYERLKAMIQEIISGEGTPRGHCSNRQLLRALRSRVVAEITNKRLVTFFGARTRRGTVQKALKALLAEHAPLSASQ